jgi:hypothetical protein
MHGSVFKRIALLRYRQGDKAKGDRTLKDSLDFYRRAMEEELSSMVKFHWVATQALALSAALGEPPDPSTFELTWQLAKRNLQHASLDEQAWAHGTLAELEMIAAHHRAEIGGPSQDPRQSVLEHCRRIMELTGAESFHVASTKRQFQRYVEYWKDERWTAVAEAAVAELSRRPGAQSAAMKA